METPSPVKNPKPKSLHELFLGILLGLSIGVWAGSYLTDKSYRNRILNGDIVCHMNKSTIECWDPSP